MTKNNPAHYNDDPNTNHITDTTATNTTNTAIAMNEKEFCDKNMNNNNNIIINNNNNNNTNNPAKKSKKRKRGSAPQKGEEGYLTPSQRRNARKRRSMQKKKETTNRNDNQQQQSNDNNNHHATNTGVSNSQDPSMTYIHDPRSAPIVQKAIQYFAHLKDRHKHEHEHKHPTQIKKQETEESSHLQKNFITPTIVSYTPFKFKTHLGPTQGWRTTSKLAVRRLTSTFSHHYDHDNHDGKHNHKNSIPNHNHNNQNSNQYPKGKIVLGLFRPGTHDIVPVPHCTAHHPSIHAAIQTIEHICNNNNNNNNNPPDNHHDTNDNNEITNQNTTSTPIEPYSENTGKGYLRYVCLNVENTTQQVQVTLVWNSRPYPQSSSKQHTGQTMMNHLVQSIIAHNSCTHINSTSTKSTSSSKTTPSSVSFPLHSLFVHFNAQGKHCNNIFDYGTNTTLQDSTSNINNSDNNKNNNNNDNNNTSDIWRLMYGQPHIIESFDLSKSNQKQSVPLHFPPNVFRQANSSAFANIVNAIRLHLQTYNRQKSKHQIKQQQSKSQKEQQQQQSKLQKQKELRILPTCLELYGGVGTIGLNLHDLIQSLICSDENPNNAKCFQQSVQCISQNNNEHQNNYNKNKYQKFKYISKNAADMVQQENALSGKDCEIVIVDPPRKGLDDLVLKGLTSLRQGKNCPKILVYVSCGFDAFQRDCNYLMASKIWKLDHAAGYLLFPGSDAIETLAFFSRI